MATVEQTAGGTEGWGERREKVVSWHDPRSASDAGRDLPGIEYLQGIADGLFPPAPIAAVMGFTIGRVADGEAWFEAELDTSHYNPIGLVHGGVVATLLDSVMGCAVHTTLPAGAGYASIEIKVSYLRPVTADTGKIVGHGWVTKPGRRVAFSEGDVRDTGGKLLATGSSSLAIVLPT